VGFTSLTSFVSECGLRYDRFRSDREVTILQDLRGGSSAGRAPALQAGGHRFDPGPLHCDVLIPIAASHAVRLP
jgi:hypothetical protein